MKTFVEWVVVFVSSDAGIATAFQCLSLHWVSFIDQIHFESIERDVEGLCGYTMCMHNGSIDPQVRGGYFVQIFNLSIEYLLSQLALKVCLFKESFCFLKGSHPDESELLLFRLAA